MRRLTLMMAFAVGLFAFQDDKPKKPTPKEKAAELLQAAFDRAPGASPEVAATALMRIADNYDGIDKSKAREALQRAFGATLGIPPGPAVHRPQVQSLVVQTAAKISLPDAIGMLKRSEASDGDFDVRQAAFDAVVTQLIAAKQFDEAIDLLNSAGVVGQYPYSSASAIYRNLPKNDVRRPAVVGAMLSAYPLRPAEPFSEFISKHWKDLPHPVAEAGVEAIVSHILSYKSDELMVQTLASAKGSITLRTRQDVELFDVMHVLRAFDKKRVDEILETHPELKAALSRFPEGRLSMGTLTVDRSNSATPEGLQQAMKAGYANEQLFRVADEIGRQFGFDLPDDVAEKNLMKALELIKGLPDPKMRVEMLSTMAGAVADEPRIARPVIEDCITLLKDIQDPDLTVEAWINLVEAAHGVHDDKLTGEALDRAFDNAAAVLKLDSDPELKSPGLRDQWPSTNAYRRLTIAATKAFGIDAEWVLSKMPDSDIALYARIEMAQALLEREHGNWMTWIRPKKS